MCGIAGFVHLGSTNDASVSQLTTMLGTLQHRGPDDSGIWVNAEQGVGLGHRRLSVLDLSPTGHQPMTSACGRFVLIFNGEIYNHLDLRKQLKSTNQLPSGGWRGRSDTETLLACFAAWGAKKTLQATIGMFALALWDTLEQSLTLTRDRIGEKPLYYGWQRDAFIFGSELKALRRYSTFTGEIDWAAVSTFLRLNYIPAPLSIYQGIFKLQPGTFLKLTHVDILEKSLPSIEPYWSLEKVVTYGLSNPFTGSFSEAVEELENLIHQAVHLQSIADVPVGAFLSGGIDSSTVVAMMQSTAASKVMTFSIGMPDLEMDESRHAAAVATHLATEHVEYIIQPEDALELIPHLSEIWDEPFADSSQIPTYLVSQLAKQYVTVVLSGDGGDEFFLGYPQYALYQKIWKTKILGALPWNLAFAANSFLFSTEAQRKTLKRAKSLVNAWRQPDMSALNRYWVDKYRQGRLPLLKEHCSVPAMDLPEFSDVAATAGIWDASTYLPDNIMVKVDRAAMSNSLETRAPLLDHHIIEFAFQLPVEFKLEKGIGKKVLREVLYRHVPKVIVDRPKMGFSIPLTTWLRYDLRSWAEKLLSQIPGDSEFFNKSMIDQMWKEHLSGHHVHTDRIWGLLTLLEFL